MEFFDFNKYNTLIFDFDGTLFDTDNANYLAYKEAIFNILQASIPFEHSRFTRESIRKYFPCINDDEMDKIINHKEYCFSKYLKDIYAIFPALNILFTAKRLRKKIILLTKASRKRVIQILENNYKNFSDNLLLCFENNHSYFKENIGDRDKYDFVFCKENITDFSRVAIFENERNMLDRLQQEKFPSDQIYSKGLLKFFNIKSNYFLSRPTPSYFHAHYSNFRNIGNPDYICYLKNDKGNILYDLLQKSKNILSEILLEDFSLLQNLYKFDMVCMVPRSKREDYYKPEQQLIRKIVSETVRKLSIDDGTMCIVREKNTRTTHRDKQDADGPMPYKGITKDTCAISDQVKGLNILLVDDIYTETVNIDEDAIQALLDKGAKSVVFYAVAKTINKRN